LSEGYATAKAIWSSGSVADQHQQLAGNFLMDRSAENWAKNLTALDTAAGACETGVQITATGELSGRFSWTCAHGTLQGAVLMAPSSSGEIQSLTLDFVASNPTD
jgi:serine-type D-Ala-D-Ala carboxypeptidase/endopeptidase